MNTRSHAARTLRDYANELIELGERASQGWDKGAWRDDVCIAARNKDNTLAAIKRDIANATAELAWVASR